MTENNNIAPQSSTPQQQYQQPVYQQPVYVPLTPQEKSARNMSIAGMVLGIVSIVIWVFGIPCGIVGLILSIIAIKRGQKGMAIAGLVCSIIGLALAIIFILFFVMMFSAAMTDFSFNMPMYNLR